jgi:hypothetical protein
MVVELTVWSLCAVAWPLAAFSSTRLLQGKAEHLQAFPSRIRIFSIPDPDFFNPGSRIRIKEFECFNPQKIASKLSEI